MTIHQLIRPTIKESLAEVNALVERLGPNVESICIMVQTTDETYSFGSATDNVSTTAGLLLEAAISRLGYHRHH